MNQTQAELRRTYQDRMLQLSLEELEDAASEVGSPPLDQPDPSPRPGPRLILLLGLAAALLVIAVGVLLRQQNPTDPPQPARQDKLTPELRRDLDTHLGNTFLNTPGRDGGLKIFIRDHLGLLARLRQQPAGWPYVRKKLPSLARARLCGWDLPALLAVWVHDPVLRPKAEALLRDEPKIFGLDHVLALAETGSPAVRRRAEAQLRQRKSWKMPDGTPMYAKLFIDLYFLGRGDRSRIPSIRMEMTKRGIKPTEINTCGLHFVCAAYLHRAGEGRDWRQGLLHFEALIEKMLRADEPAKTRVRRAESMLGTPRALHAQLSRGDTPALAFVLGHSYFEWSNHLPRLRSAREVRAALAALSLP